MANFDNYETNHQNLLGIYVDEILRTDVLQHTTKAKILKNSIFYQGAHKKSS